MKLHYPCQYRQHSDKCKYSKEDEHPFTHTLLVLLILFITLNTLFNFAYTFFRFSRDINATYATMLVRRNHCLRFGTLWHVLCFLSDCFCINHLSHSGRTKVPSNGLPSNASSSRRISRPSRTPIRNRASFAH